MDPGVWVPIIVAVVTFVGLVLTNKVTKGSTKVTSQADVIDSLQEQLDRQEKRIEKLERADRQMKADKIIDQVHMAGLEHFIYQGKPPPPPPRPVYPKVE